MRWGANTASTINRGYNYLGGTGNPITPEEGNLIYFAPLAVAGEGAAEVAYGALSVLRQ